MAIAGSSRRTAATGAAAPSSAQLRPPNAMSDVPTAHCAKTTSSPRSSRPCRLPPTPAPRTRGRWRRATRSRLQQQRPLAQPRRLVLQLVQPRAPGDEPIDRPAGQAEQPQLLAGRRIDRQPIRIVGVALRAADLVGVAVVPDRALAQQPVRRQPAAGEHERRPPGEGEQHDRRGEAADQLDQAAGDEVHRDTTAAGPVMPRSKSRATVRSAGERRVFEVAHARRAHARFGQPVVEPRRRAIAEVVR